MQKLQQVSKDGCDFLHVMAIATPNLGMWVIAARLTLTQSNPLLCSSYCILFSAACLIFLSIYGVQKRQRLMMLGTRAPKTAENHDTALHALSWLQFSNSMGGVLLALLGLATRFHSGQLHPVSF
jgi:hypothetical protein